VVRRTLASTSRVFSCSTPKPQEQIRNTYWKYTYTSLYVLARTILSFIFCWKTVEKDQLTSLAKLQRASEYFGEKIQLLNWELRCLQLGWRGSRENPGKWPLEQCTESKIRQSVPDVQKCHGLAFVINNFHYALYERNIHTMRSSRRAAPSRTTTLLWSFCWSQRSDLWPPWDTISVADVTVVDRLISRRIRNNARKPIMKKSVPMVRRIRSGYSLTKNYWNHKIKPRSRSYHVHVFILTSNTAAVTISETREHKVLRADHLPHIQQQPSSSPGRPICPRRTSGSKVSMPMAYILLVYKENIRVHTFTERSKNKTAITCIASPPHLSPAERYHVRESMTHLKI
jgi:hypothetical protein